MNTQFALLARFGKREIALNDISEEFFGLLPKTANARANDEGLPIPTYRLIDSQKAPRLVDVEVLANYIDEQREKAAQNWRYSNT
ncbi:hypothetical protein JL49_09115 [Pseudoalteromonas luteoviolacea]|nr:hypothetical protein JL49_09115 [Pseudoalteromonas luteoviolacea]